MYHIQRRHGFETRHGCRRLFKMKKTRCTSGSSIQLFSLKALLLYCISISMTGSQWGVSLSLVKFLSGRSTLTFLNFSERKRQKRRIHLENRVLGIEKDRARPHFRLSLIGCEQAVIYFKWVVRFYCNRTMSFTFHCFPCSENRLNLDNAWFVFNGNWISPLLMKQFQWLQENMENWFQNEDISVMFNGYLEHVQ